MTNYCIDCGKEIEGDGDYCPKCDPDAQASDGGVQSPLAEVTKLSPVSPGPQIPSEPKALKELLERERPFCTLGSLREDLLKFDLIDRRIYVYFSDPTERKERSSQAHQFTKTQCQLVAQVLNLARDREELVRSVRQCHSKSLSDTLVSVCDSLSRAEASPGNQLHSATVCKSCQREVLVGDLLCVCEHMDCNSCLDCTMTSLLNREPPSCPKGHTHLVQTSVNRLSPQVAARVRAAQSRKESALQFRCPGTHEPPFVVDFPLRARQGIHCNMCSVKWCSDCRDIDHPFAHCYQVPIARKLWPLVWASWKDPSKATAVAAELDQYAIEQNSRQTWVECAVCHRAVAPNTLCRCQNVSTGASKRASSWGTMITYQASLNGPALQPELCKPSKGTPPSAWYGFRCDLCPATAEKFIIGIRIQCLHCQWNCCYNCALKATSPDLGHKRGHSFIVRTKPEDDTFKPVMDHDAIEQNEETVEARVLRNVNKEVVYEGDLVGKIRHGTGAEWEPGTKRLVYRGEWSQDLYHGKGRLIKSNGDQYEGHFEKGEPHGRGKCVLADGSSYEGEFVRGQYWGKGKFEVPQTEIYEGNFCKGLREGEGVLTNIRLRTSTRGKWVAGNLEGATVTQYLDPDSLLEKVEHSYRSGTLHGEQHFHFRRGLKVTRKYNSGELEAHGIMRAEYYRFEGELAPDHQTRIRGKQFNACGQVIYDGTWTFDRMTGTGSLYLAEGRYTGSVSDGKRHGKGQMDFASVPVSFTGYWKDDLRDGDGRQTFRSSGLVVTGKWNHGVPPTSGVLLYNNGKTYSGDLKWSHVAEQPLPDGTGTLTARGGRAIYSGSWLNGVYHGVGTLQDKGSVVRGRFSNGRPDGEGIIVQYPDGTYWQGRMSCGERLQGEYCSPDGLTKMTSAQHAMHLYRQEFQEKEQAKVQSIQGQREAGIVPPTTAAQLGIAGAADKGAFLGSIVWSTDRRFTVRNRQLLHITVPLAEVSRSSPLAKLQPLNQMGNTFFKAELKTDLKVVSNDKLRFRLEEDFIYFVLYVERSTPVDGTNLMSVASTEAEIHELQLSVEGSETVAIEIAIVPTFERLVSTTSSPAVHSKPVSNADDQKEDIPDLYERPVHLVEVDETKKLIMPKRIAEALSRLEGIIKVICICGPAREGKSYLLNLFAGVPQGSDGGFDTGPTTNPCTKGLFTWAIRNEFEGKKETILLIDTEGTGDPKRGPGFDDHVLALSVLLSSILIYNTKAPSVQTAASQIQSFTRGLLSAYQSGLAENTGADADGPGGNKGVFFWVIRDKKNNDYSAQILKESFEKLQVWTAATAFFRSLDMRGLVQPCEEKYLANVQLVPPDSPVLNSAFFVAAKDLIRECYKLSAAKKIKGNPATGMLLVSLIEGYLEWSWSHATGKNLWHETCLALNTRLSAKLTDELVKSMPTEPTKPSAFDALLQEKITAAKNTFVTDSQYADDAQQEAFAAQLMDQAVLLRCANVHRWSTFTTTRCCDFWKAHGALPPPELKIEWDKFSRDFSEADDMVMKRFNRKVESQLIQNIAANSNPELEEEKKRLAVERERKAKEAEKTQAAVAQRIQEVELERQTAAEAAEAQLKLDAEKEKARQADLEKKLQTDIQNGAEALQKSLAALKATFARDQADITRQTDAENATYLKAQAEYQRQQSLYSDEIARLLEEIAALNKKIKGS